MWDIDIEDRINHSIVRILLDGVCKGSIELDISDTESKEKWRTKVKEVLNQDIL